MSAAATPSSTSAALTLLLQSLTLLLSTAVAQSALLANPPFAVNATNTAITFKAEAECPPNCRVDYITWQLRVPNATWSPERKAHVETPYTFDGLLPGTRYEVRALLDMGGKPYLGSGVHVITAYTCSDKVPRVETVEAAELSTDSVLLRWYPPRETCAGVQYYFQQELYRLTYGRLSEQCPPTDLLSPQPNYTCVASASAAGGRECSVSIRGLEAGDKYAFGIVGVDWAGRCSVMAFKSVETKRGPSPFGLSIGAWSCLILVIMIISASTPCLYSYWKRRTGRSLFGEDENIA